MYGDALFQNCIASPFIDSWCHLIRCHFSLLSVTLVECMVEADSVSLSVEAQLAITSALAQCFGVCVVRLRGVNLNRIISMHNCRHIPNASQTKATIDDSLSFCKLDQSRGRSGLITQ